MTEDLKRKWKFLLQICLKSSKTSPLAGYTLIEILVVCSIIGILAALVINAKPWYQNSLGDSRDQVTSLLNAVRLKAMSTTSTYRVRPDPANPTRQLKVEQTTSGSCQASTTLTTAATATAQSLSVNSVNGFSVGDKIQVGSDSANNDVVALDPDTQKITLGQTLGTAQAANASVVMLKNWVNESSFTTGDLTLAKDITMLGIANAQTTDWSMCFNSRGIISFFDGSNKIQNTNLTLILNNTKTAKANQVNVYSGGAMDTKYIASATIPSPSPTTTPSPSPSPTTTPSPSPSPISTAMCTMPDLVGLDTSTNSGLLAVKNKIIAAGLKVGKFNNQHKGNSNRKIIKQYRKAGLRISCDTKIDIDYSDD